MTLPEDCPCFASLHGVAGGWWWPWDTAQLAGQQVNLCWQREGLDIRLSSSYFSPSKELQSTELCIPHSCSFIVVLQIHSPSSCHPCICMSCCPCLKMTKWAQRGEVTSLTQSSSQTPALVAVLGFVWDPRSSLRGWWGTIDVLSAGSSLLGAVLDPHAVMLHWLLWCDR